MLGLLSSITTKMLRPVKVVLLPYMIVAFVVIAESLTPAAAASEVTADLSGLPWPSGVSISSRGTRAFEAWRGRPLDLETVFFGLKTWAHMSSSTRTLRTKLPTVPGRLVVALGLVPADYTGQVAECAAGLFDPQIHAIASGMLVNGAAAAAAVGKPLLLRLGWEANAVDSGFPWYVVGDGAAWRACFRRWVDILNPIADASTVPPTRAKNFIIVWNMANRGTFPHPIDNIWPGDDYVDVVASQFYDRCPPLPEGNNAEWARRLSARDAHGNPAGPLAWLNYARSKNKPYAIAEWGVGGPNDVCARPGIDNPYFIRKMHEFFQTHAEDIAFEAYFNFHGYVDDSKGTCELFAPEPDYPDPTTPGYLAYTQRYNPRSAGAYRELWGREATPMPAVLSVAALAATGPEGDEGATPFVFTVSRTGNPDRALTVRWRVAGSVSGDDFVDGVLPAGTLRLAAGETAASFTVMIRGDREEEADEVLEMTLAESSDGATIGTASAGITVLNDDVEPPVLAIAAVVASRAEGASGSSATFTFAVTRTGDTRRPVSVKWGVIAGDADAADFLGGSLPAGSLTLVVGERRKTFIVRVAGDTEVERDEVLSVVLSAPSAGASISTETATATIVNDDVEPSVLSVTAVAAAANEGHGDTPGFTFSVHRAGDLSRAVTVRWQVGGGSADDTDFASGVLPAGTVSLVPQESAAILTVPIQGDTLVEPDETFVVTLAEPTGGARLGTDKAFGTILNDDAEPAVLSLVALDAVKSEGEHGLMPFTFRVVRSGDSRRAVSAAWSVVGTDASADDFFRAVLPSGTVWLVRGETSRTLTVMVQSDRRVEADETFAVTLSAPTNGATIGTATAVGTILNDDASSPVLSVAAAAAVSPEGNSGVTSLTFTVTRTGDPRLAAFARWQVVAGETDADDFAGKVLPAGTVRLAAGATSTTLSVPVQGDLKVEQDEVFSVVLSAPSANAVLGAATAFGTIVNDDAEPGAVGVTAVDAFKPEGKAGATRFTFVVSRSGYASKAVTIGWRTQGVGRLPAAGSDFVGGRMPSGTVTFAVGETRKTITVQVAGDARREPAEAFAIVLTTAGSGLVLRPAAANALILSDDR